MAIDPPTCNLTLAESFMAAALADCPSFQSFVGVDPLITDPAARAAAALLKIYFDATPPPANPTTGYTLAECLAQRPCCILFTDLADGFHLGLEAMTGGNFDFGAGGRLGMQFEWTIPDGLGEDEAAMCRVLRNFIGGIFDELADRAGKPGFLAIRSMRLTNGPHRINPEFEAQRGRLMTVWTQVTWSNTTGGTYG